MSEEKIRTFPARIDTNARLDQMKEENKTKIRRQSKRDDICELYTRRCYFSSTGKSKIWRKKET